MSADADSGAPEELWYCPMCEHGFLKSHTSDLHGESTRYVRADVPQKREDALLDLLEEFRGWGPKSLQIMLDVALRDAGREPTE